MKKPSRIILHYICKTQTPNKPDILSIKDALQDICSCRIGFLVQTKEIAQGKTHQLVKASLYLEMRVGVQQQLLLVALEEEKCCSRREFPSCSL